MVLNLLRLIKINFLIFLFFSCDEINKKDKNVIIILADDLGYSDLSYFGSEIKTNNIDFLIVEGENFYIDAKFYKRPFQLLFLMLLVVLIKIFSPLRILSFSE